MKSPYRQLLIIGVAMGVLTSSLFFGVGQSLFEYQLVMNEALRLQQSLLKITYTEHAQGKTYTMGISLENAILVRERLSHVSPVAILSAARGVKVKHKGEFLNQAVVLTDEAFMSMDRITITHGRGITAEDMQQAAPVCLISNQLESYLGLTEDMMIIIEGQEFLVVGVFTANVSAEQGPDRSINYDSAIFVPATSAYDHIWETSRKSAMITMLVIEVEDEGLVQALKGQLNNLLTELPTFPPLSISSGATQLEAQFKEQLKILGAIFSVSLLIMLVAGINIVQIATANVLDRTGEIGLRIAVGATSRDIFRQIAGEILTCSLQGGLLGILVSGLLHISLNHHLGTYFVSFNMVTALQGLTLALLTGLVTAIMPAKSATKLDPVNALRKGV